MAPANWTKYAALILPFVFMPAHEVLADVCPTCSEAGRFQVYERAIDYADGYAHADHQALSALLKDQNASLGKSMGGSALSAQSNMLDDNKIDNQLSLLGAPSAVAAKRLPASQEAIFINGLADFIETRARAELRMWLTRFLSEELCGDGRSVDLFPNTCALNIHDSNSVFGIEQQYLALVLALRKDLEYLPACVVERRYNTDFGYLLQSVIQGYANNGKLDNLLYGLAGKLETYPVHNAFERVFSFSVLAYASAIEVEPVWVENKNAAAAKFLLQLSQRVDRSNNPDYVVYLNALVKEISTVQTHLEEFYALRQSVLDTTARIKAAASREEVAALFIKNGEQVLEQLLVLLRVGDMQTEIEKLRGNENIIHALYSGYQAIEVHEYTRAYLDLKPVLDDAYKNTGDETLKKQLKVLNNFSGAVVSLAEAKSADDFSGRLDSLASPAGAWRLKNQAGVYSLTALPGIRVSRDAYSSPGLPGVLEEDVYGIGAPLGIQVSWPKCGGAGRYCGLMFSVLDLGNIINAPGDIETPNGRITGNVESSFSNVFTPGIYFSVTPFKNAPFNLTVGYSEGPSSGYRALITDSGDEFPVERDSMISISLSVDVTFFTF